jgi:ppGpp synthetase/RelA/SpoT-type nucleotidyltranferase
MKWVEPKHSRKRIRKAGCVLCNLNEASEKESRDAFVSLMNWRAAHAYPMHCLLMLLRHKAGQIDKGALVVQRLKRLRSVVFKLIRFQNMSLDRMHDIAGCRAVVSDLQRVRRLYAALKQSRTRHKLQREYDYITQPKESGYRAIHLVYRYGGRKRAYDGLLVEIQLRSRIQHSWATAVEVVDTFTRQSLKTSQGSAQWTAFFQATREAFAMLEGTATRTGRSWDEIQEEVIASASALHVEQTLRSFAVSTQYLPQERKLQSYEFFLLELDASEPSVRIHPYRQAAFEAASKEYLRRERATREDETKDIVLVAAASIRALKQAYRNYFADTDEFLRNLQGVLANKALNRTSGSRRRRRPPESG